MSRGQTNQSLPSIFVHFYHLTKSGRCGKMAARAHALGPVFLSIVNFNKNAGENLCKITVDIYPEIVYT
jgi:hypothetical protein